MVNDQIKASESELKLALSLTEKALAVCDAAGFALAAIDLCAAAEKLKDMQRSHDDLC